jgi:anti-sigma B factor antagonist
MRATGSAWFSSQPHEPRPRLLVRPVQEILIIDFLNAQAIAGEQEAGELGGCLMRLAREGQTRILLNLSGVHYVSSSLVGCLAWLHRRLTAANGFLKLYGLETMLHDALKLCGLDRTFEIFHTEAEALESAGVQLEDTLAWSPDR